MAPVLVSALGRLLHGLSDDFRLVLTFTTMTDETLRIIGTAIASGLIYGLRCSLVRRKESRNEARSQQRPVIAYRLAYRLGKLWALRQQRGRKSLSGLRVRQ